MPVFDFNNTPEEGKISECTYTIFRTNESIANPEHPILVLDNKGKNLKHHSEGLFINPIKRTAFEFKEEKETVSDDILEPYQCMPLRCQYRRRLCGIQNP